MWAGSASIAQTGYLSLTVKWLSFRVAANPGAFVVSFAGQVLSYVAASEPWGSECTADVSQFAGTSGELKFVVSQPGELIYLDSISFSGQPELSVSRTTTSAVAVSWPSPSTGWVLQQNTNAVSSANWSNVTSGIQDDGTIKTFSADPATGNCFYRLSKP
jgi:hypothetical protein